MLRRVFHRWYCPVPAKRGAGAGVAQFWNQLPEPVSDPIVRLALAQPAGSARQHAWLFTPFGPKGPAHRGGTPDQEGYFVPESSVLRLLKRFDMVESPAFEPITAADRFAQPTRRVNHFWQTDFRYSHGARHMMIDSADSPCYAIVQGS